MAPGGRYVIILLAALGLPLAALAAVQIALGRSADPHPAARSAAHLVAAATAPPGAATSSQQATAAPGAADATTADPPAASGSVPSATDESTLTSEPGLPPAGTPPTGGGAASGGAAGGGAADSGGIGAAGPAGTHATEITLRSGRSYDLHTTVRPGRPRPLVVLLHAYLHDAAVMRDISGATPFADGHGFALAYGHAVDGAWNAGTCCAGTHGVDDVAYLRDLVADASRRTSIDPARVYVWGYSNGGMMAARAVCEAPDVFAAAGVVAGHLLVPCDQSPIRMMHIHGTEDTTVPWRGGWSDYVDVSFPDARTESSRVTSSSVVVGVPWPGGHEWPWWAVGRLWEFSAEQRTGRHALAGTP